MDRCKIFSDDWDMPERTTAVCGCGSPAREHPRRPVPPGVPNVAKLYKVTAQCENSRKYIGFRAGAYLCCSDFCGFFDKDESSSFKYSETGDLEISLLFKSEDNARKFINKMIEHCLFFKITFTHRLDELPLIEGIQFSPVYWDHYKHIQASDEAEQSPEYSLLAVSNSSVSEYLELSNVEDPYTVLMMIERSDLREFTAAAPYRCHLIGKKNKKYETDINNILHLSWTMHDWLDGLNRKRRLAGQKKIPSIKVTAVGREEAERKKLRDGTEVDTVNVFIKIWSANAVLMKDLESMLKEGSFKDADGAWITFVNVIDVDTFKYCLECKALQTQKLWDENGGCRTEL
mmetsp:Transcript_26174/g.37481  ORF Transcript_26174/g.37481 Transcript_26174/m.37481 type:complete len:346 (-) Transcript_26174:540-1577(-)